MIFEFMKETSNVSRLESKFSQFSSSLKGSDRTQIEHHLADHSIRLVIARANLKLIPVIFFLEKVLNNISGLDYHCGLHLLEHQLATKSSVMFP